MRREFRIEQEHVPAFRVSVKAVADPLTLGAGDAGEVIYLDTKVFEQDYMVFCDNFAANDFNPAHARSDMRRRRTALFPYLGQPLLHGGPSHAGFLLNVFVDKASGVVIHWESREELR